MVPRKSALILVAICLAAAPAFALSPPGVLWSGDVDAYYEYSESSTSLGSPDTLLEGDAVTTSSGRYRYNYPVPTAPFQVIIGVPSNVITAGQADAGRLEALAVGRASSNRVASVISQFANVYTVGAGSSGLQPGDPVTVRMTIRHTGITSVNINPDAGDTSSWAEVHAGLEIRDPSRSYDTGEGFIVPTIVDYELSLLYTVGHNPNSRDRSFNYDWQWDIDVNGISVAADRDNVFESVPDDTIQVCADPSYAYICLRDRTFDTGTRTFSFESAVGAQLQIVGGVSILSQARGQDAIAIGDFARGFAVTIESATPGVELTAAVAPLTADDTATAAGGTHEEIPVLANDAPDATLQAVGTPSHGVAAANADGTITYTADAAYVGADAFTYTARDAAGYTEQAQVQVQVSVGNHAPVATDDAAVTDEGAPVVIDVLANDTDADGDALTLAAVASGGHGSAAINGDATVTYTPEPGFSGEDTFTYSVADGRGGTDQGAVGVTVEAIPASGADLSVSATASPDPAAEGDTLTYRITLRNRGPEAASEVVLSQALPASRFGSGPTYIVLPWVQFTSAEPSQGTCSEADATVTCALGDLAAGATAMVTVAAKVATSGRTLPSTVSLTAATTDADTTNNQATVETAVAARADLAVSASASPNPAPIGGTLRYDLTVSNAGPNTASAAWLDFNLPSAASFLWATLPSGEACSEDGGRVHCALGDLPSGESAAVIVAVAPTAVADLEASATVGSGTPDPTADNNIVALGTPAQKAADMELALAAPPGPILEGSPWTVEFTITNHGPEQVKDPTLTLDLPTGASLITPGDYVTCGDQGTTVTCDLPYRFPSGTGVTLSFTFGAPAQTGSATWGGRIAASQPDPYPHNNTVTHTAEIVTATNVWPTSLEVTQGLQDLENDIPLVAGRETSVRAYLQASANVAGVRARLHAFRGGGELPGSPLAPEERTIPARTDGGRRLHVEEGFWFRLPLAWRQGTVTLQVEVNPDRTLAETDYEDNTAQTTVTFHAGEPLNLMMVPLHINPGSEETMWASYTVNERSFAEIIRGLMRYHPIGEINLWTFEDQVYPKFHLLGNEWDLRDPIDQGKMLARIWWKNFWTKDVAEKLHYVGMVGPGVDTAGVEGLSILGYESWAKMKTVCYTENGSWFYCSPRWFIPGGAYIAHELGHNLGFFHVLCAGNEEQGGPVNFRYPWPYPQCQLADIDPAGYYGFDVYHHATDETPLPATISNDPQAPAGHVAFPLMGYKSPQWVSPYEYCQLLEKYGIPCDGASLYSSLGAPPAPGFPVDEPLSVQAAAVGPRGAALLSADRFVALSGIVDAATVTAEIYSVYQLDDPPSDAVAAAAELADQPTPSTYTLVQLGAAGQILDSQPLAVRGEGPEDGVRAFAVLVVLAEGAEALEVRDGDVVLARREASATPPTVRLIAPNGGEALADGALVRWEASDPDGDPLSFTVLYSPDAGQSWREVAMGVTGGQLELASLADLPGSMDGLFRVVANDGFLTAHDDSDGPVSVPGSPPHAFILQPADGDAVAVGSTVLFQGLATDTESGPIGDEDLIWHSDRDGDLGQGRELLLHGLSEGIHRISLHAVDGDGQQGEAVVSLTVGDPAANSTVNDNKGHGGNGLCFVNTLGLPGSGAALVTAAFIALLAALVVTATVLRRRVSCRRRDSGIKT